MTCIRNFAQNIICISPLKLFFRNWIELLAHGQTLSFAHLYYNQFISSTPRPLAAPLSSRMCNCNAWASPRQISQYSQKLGVCKLSILRNTDGEDSLSFYGVMTHLSLYQSTGEQWHRYLRPSDNVWITSSSGHQTHTAKWCKHMMFNFWL